jgi:hypothetical protein
VFQGDRFDNPDRLFQSIQHSWMSASGGVSADPSTQTSNLQDVKELIPEFYYLPDFLCNINGYQFGRTSRGDTIDDVELPPWAKGSAELFILKHRYEYCIFHSSALDRTYYSTYYILYTMKSWSLPTHLLIHLPHIY